MLSLQGRWTCRCRLRFAATNCNMRKVYRPTVCSLQNMQESADLIVFYVCCWQDLVWRERCFCRALMLSGRDVGERAGDYNVWAAVNTVACSIQSHVQSWIPQDNSGNTENCGNSKYLTSVLALHFSHQAVQSTISLYIVQLTSGRLQQGLKCTDNCSGVDFCTVSYSSSLYDIHTDRNCILYL